MRLRPALLLTFLLVLVATTVPGQAAPSASAPSLAALSDIRGVAYSNVSRPPALLIADLPRLQSIGVNHITFYVYLFVDDPSSSEVKRGPTTPTDLELTTAIDRAHAAGMTVTVSPLPFYGKGNVWRGTFEPDDPDAFFDSWRFYTTHYARMSERHDVELFSIGSEQNSLQEHTEQWRRTAAEARKHFTGPLTYMATEHESLESVQFWDALDVVSVSPYFGVSERAHPTYGEVRAVWQDAVMPRLRQIGEATGKKVLIGETGFVNAQYFGRATYNPTPSTVPAPRAQADAYQAVLDALAATPDAPTFLLGINWWDWDPYSTSAAQPTYSPRGKPAECVLARTWGSGVVRTANGLLSCGTR